MRARVDIESFGKDGERTALIVKEFPYQVNKARVVEKIAELVREKRIEGISDLRDESDREGIRVVIELKRGTVANVVLNSLYKFTQLQETFGMNLLGLIDNQPRVLNLKEILRHFIQFRKEVVTRRTEFDLRKAREKEHIFEGFKIAVDNLDDVVKLIRGSKDPIVAREALVQTFGLSDLQGKAILEMRLQRLTGLERQKIIDDLAETRKNIAELENILAKEPVKLKIIKEELQEVKNNYGDERRTEIQDTGEADISIEDMIADEDMVVTYSRSGYIKRDNLENYRAQRRGGKGVKGISLREEDVVQELLIASTLTDLLIFTNIGRVHWMKVYKIPEASRTAKGKPIVNLLNLKEGERPASILSVPAFEEGTSVISFTRNGIVKKTDLKAYSRPRQGGIIGLTVDSGDQVIAVRLSDGTKDILLATEKGMAIRFKDEEIRSMGRTARGVIGIRLKEGDQVIGAEIVEPGKTILSVSERGLGKRTPVDDYPLQGRGGFGVITLKSGEKTGSLVGVRQVTESDEILVISSDGKIIRMNTTEISLIGRNTQGVRVVHLSEEDRLVSFEKLVEPEQDD
tara:strand:- start:2234 stop:3955 length:1722 start_codon:yes stop_codon:yes gene_type:complete